MFKITTQKNFWRKIQMTQSEKLLINFKVSEALQDLVKNCVMQANNEVVSLTALIELVRK